MPNFNLSGVLITPATAAAKKVVDLSNGVYDAATGGMRPLPASIELVGVLGAAEEIAIEYPLVVDPDPAEDGDWAQYYYRDEAVKLTDTNHSETVVSSTLFRLNKPITAAAAGVRIV